MELPDAEVAAPGSLRRLGQRRRQAVHVVAAVTVVTEQQLVLGGGGRGLSAPSQGNAGDDEYGNV